VLAAGGDRAVHLFDAARGTALGKTAGHDAPVYALAAAPDGRTIAAAGQDGKIVVFSRTGRPTPPTQPPAQKPQLPLAPPRERESETWVSPPRLPELGERVAAERPAVEQRREYSVRHAERPQVAVAEEQPGAGGPEHRRGRGERPVRRM